MCLSVGEIFLFVYLYQPTQATLSEAGVVCGELVSMAAPSSLALWHGMIWLRTDV